MDYDPDTTTVKRKETEAQRKKRLKCSITAVLNTAEGRDVLAEILGLCQVEAVNGQDGMAAGRIEGARAVGINTIRLLRDNDPAGWMNLYREINDGR